METATSLIQRASSILHQSLLNPLDSQKPLNSSLVFSEYDGHLRRGWATSGMLLLAGNESLSSHMASACCSPVKAFTGTGGEVNSLGSFYQEKRDVGGLALADTQEVSAQCLAIQPCWQWKN